MGSVAALIVEVAAVAVLLASGGGKLFAPRSFANAISQVIGASTRTSLGLSRAVAVTELLAVVLVAFGWLPLLRAIPLMVIGCGIVVFTAIAVSRHVSVECGCFGDPGSSPLGWRNALFGTVLILAGVLLTFIDRGTSLGQGAEYAVIVLLLAAACALLAGLARRREQLGMLLSRGLGRDQ